MPQRCAVPRPTAGCGPHRDAFVTDSACPVLADEPERRHKTTVGERLHCGAYIGREFDDGVCWPHADSEERDNAVRARLAADLTGIAINDHAATVGKGSDMTRVSRLT